MKAATRKEENHLLATLPPDQLLGVRRHLQAHHAEFRSLLAAKKLSTAMNQFEGASRKRVPRGFAADSPAADLLLQTRWGLSATLPAEAAIEPSLVKEIVRRFRLAAPVVEFLNAGIMAGRGSASATDNPLPY